MKGGGEPMKVPLCIVLLLCIMILVPVDVAVPLVLATVEERVVLIFVCRPT